MKGVIFVSFSEMVEERFGLRMWDALIQSTRPQTGGAYTVAGTYDENELGGYLAELSRRVDLPQTQLLRSFGEYLVGAFYKRYPNLFQYNSAKEFLKAVNGVIHREVRKLYADAEPPAFSCRELTEQRLELEYRSRRGLCVLAEGLIAGMGAHFNQPVRVDHPICMHRGAEFCVLSVELGDGTK